MIKITKKSGVTKSAVYCDKCGNGTEWDGLVSFTQMERMLRNKGWTCGKRHVCAVCLEKKA
jgi:hypothetical protein